MSELTTTRPSPASQLRRTLGAVRLPTLATWLILLATVIVSALAQETFFSSFSIASNLATMAPLVIVAAAQALVIIGGGLDLSIGAIVALSSVATLQLMGGRDSAVALGVVAATAVGAGCGALNGALVALLRLQPLIATFATASIFSGVALLVLPAPGGTMPASVTNLYQNGDGLLALPLAIILLVVAIWLLARRTRLVRHLYAVGGDAPAAYASGVGVTTVRLVSYLAAGALAGFAGFVLLANTGSGDAGVAGDIALNSIAAVVLGGVALRGGVGSPIGAMGGAVILTLITNILFFIGVPTTYRELANGVVIVAALAVSVLLSNTKRKAAR